MKGKKNFGIMNKISLFTAIIMLTAMVSGCGNSSMLFETSASNNTHPEASDVSENTENSVVEETEANEGAADHEHVLATETVREATCSSVGRVRTYCTVDGCGYEYTENIDRLAHTPGDWTFLYDAEGGHYESQVCSVCGENVNIRFVENTPVETSAAEENVDDTDEENSSNESSNQDEDVEQTDDDQNTETDQNDDVNSGENNNDNSNESENNNQTDNNSGNDNQVEDDKEDQNSTETPGNTENQEDQEEEQEHSHSYDEGVITKEPTCEEDGVIVYTCKCGESYEEPITKLGHDWDDGIETKAATCIEEGEITYTCKNDPSHTRTESIEKVDHTWDEGVVTEEPTCTAEGVKTYTCSVCQETKTEPVAATGHEYDEGVVTTEPTCETEGVKTYTCIHGDDSYTETIPALEHDWDEGTKTKDATCIEEGEITYTCKNDPSHTRTESIEKVDHTWDEGVVTEEPTCTAEGVRTYTCSVCQETKTEPVAATGHHYGEGVTTKEPTCEEDGTITYFCDCGDYYEEPIAKLGHDYEKNIIREADCENDGIAVYVCKNNSAHTYEETIAATGHDDGEWVVVREASYTETGLRELKCTKCGKVLDSEIIDVIPHEHNYVLVDSEDATCVNDGYETYACDICNDSYTNPIKAEGHNYEWQVTKEATCEESGLESNVCSKCGDVSETKVIEAKGHTESDWIVDAEATCESDGKRHTECGACGAVIKEETVQAKGHQWGEVIVTVEPTEEAEGEGYQECAICHDTKSVVIDKLEQHEHTYEITDSKEATCTEEGYETYTCTQCDDSYTKTYPKTEHTLGEWETVTEATEDTDGQKVQKCTVCGNTINTEVIPKLPHTHTYAESDRKEATCEEDGYITYTCEKGDDSYTETLKATGHAYEVSNQKDATCEEDGYIEYTCKNDPTHIKKETITATGHNYVETERKEATCEEDGYIKYTCSNCQETYEEPILHGEHDYEVIKTVEATCTQDGYEVYRCKNCNDEYTKTIEDSAGHKFEWVVTKEAQLGVEGEEAHKCSVCQLVDETRATDMLMTDGTNNVYQVCIGYEDDGTPILKTVIGHFDEEASALIAEKVNTLRESQGLNALNIVTDGSLQDFAKVRNIEIGWEYTSTGSFSHKRPTEESTVSTEWKLGENIAMNGAVWNKDSETIASELYTQWFNSQGHYNNMVRDTYKSISVSVFVMKVGEYNYYFGVQNFAMTNNYKTYTGDAWDSLINNY